MGKKITLVKNSAGRKIPTIVNGVKTIPFKGVGKYTPKGMKASSPIRSCQNYPTSGNKVVGTLKDALKKCGIKNGMTISNHHHFRNGDLIMNQVFDIAANMGVKNLRWFPSASFPCHEPMIVIHHIEGSLNGPLGNYASEGKMKGMAVLRSHGGRWKPTQIFYSHICSNIKYLIHYKITISKMMVIRNCHTIFNTTFF
jgi:citrate lyase subunit alpha/citrate CoA-transferase